MRRSACFLLLCSLLLSAVFVQGQINGPHSNGVTAAASPAGIDHGFRIEKLPVAGGSEVLTIFAKRMGGEVIEAQNAAEIPLVSILRDTLGDDDPTNDRLRYVWMLTHTRASKIQKISAFVPFLYMRTTNNSKIDNRPPPAILDVQASDQAMWDKVFWEVFKKLVLSEFGIGVRASARHYRRNTLDYRRSAVASAMAVLSLYKEVNGGEVLSNRELRDIQARLSLSDTLLGWRMQSENLGRVFEKERARNRDTRGNNWELLRQYAESQGLYFEPLQMPDETTRHAILWAAESDIAANKGRKFESRFLNIKNPWTDPKLTNWKGYRQVRWYDAEDRIVPADTPNAAPRTLIPLAIYGLDHPKIPALLVDFRNNGNTKRREMSRRVLNDLTSDVISLSRFGGLPYTFGRFFYDFATQRRGLDVNQVSRMRSYSQLKLLLALDASLDPEFEAEIERRVEHATLNPMENDTDVESKIARNQYENLMAFAKDPKGLPRRVMNDRRAEMVRLKHGGKQRTLFSIAHVFSLGFYTHREKHTPELFAQMDKRRQLDFHERVLSEVAYDSARPEIDSDIQQVRRSLTFVSENGAASRTKTARSLAKIFSMTSDDDIRELCLTAMYRIDNSSAKKELLAIYNNTKSPVRWRELSARYLKLAAAEGHRMSARDAEQVSGIALH